ncbi:MAG: ATP-binding protein [Acidimicrobiaceae bacterium]|nr:ATP-binding protein [Acidimicrobiia bacterium]MCY4493975.1 ATP-binding protein [Acidimicrobiaceae bacterium]
MAASADHVKALVKSHSAGDDQAFYSVALQVAAKAARQGHHQFAADVKSLVNEGKADIKPSRVTAIAQPRGDLADLVVASYPETSLRDLVVPSELTESLEHIIVEQRQRHSLMDQGFNPVHRLLLEGPPGTGKTMTAGVLAHELDLPLLTTRLDGLLSKYLGETGSKLRVLFDAVASQRAVYLFDEFDALGGDRAGNDVGEARRILNSFLLFIENVGPESVVVAATNHRSILDHALFRRFDLVLTYSLPSPEESVEVLRGRLGSLAPRSGWATIEKHVGGLSHAELVKAAEAAAKRCLLAGKKRLSVAQLVKALEERSSTNSA